MKKFISLLVVAAFALTLVPVAKADTISDLMAQITALQAQIAALSGTTTTGTACFSTNLKLGMRTADVKMLQEKLGVSNTGYFGPLTLAAVKTFQAANGVPATGFVGELTRAKLNAKYCVATTPTTVPGTTLPAGCTSTTGYSSTTGAKCDGTVATTVTPTEGSITLGAAPIATVGTIKKGETQNVLAVNVLAKNSDVSIKRVSFNITKKDNDITPWKAFSAFDLYQDSTKIATIDASSKLSYDENHVGSDYTVRFEGLNIAVAKNTSANLVLKVTVPSSPVEVEAHNFQILKDGIRVVDTMGLNQYNQADYPATAKTLAAANASSFGAVAVSVDATNLKDGVVAISKTETKTYEALKVDLKVTNRDVTLKTVTVNLSNDSTFANANVTGYISGVSLYDGSTLLQTAAPVFAAGKTSALFDNLSLNIAKDSTKVLTVKADWAPAVGTGTPVVYHEGDKLAVQFASATFIDNDDNNGSSTGTVNGSVMTGNLIGLTVSNITSSITKNTDSTGSGLSADAKITFNLTANGDQVSLNGITGTKDGIVAKAYNASSEIVPNTEIITVDGKVLGATPIIMADGQTVTIVVTGRLAATAGTVTTWMYVDSINYNTDKTFSGDVLTNVKSDPVTIEYSAT